MAAFEVWWVGIFALGGAVAHLEPVLSWSPDATFGANIRNTNFGQEICEKITKNSERTPENHHWYHSFDIITVGWLKFKVKLVKIFEAVEIKNAKNGENRNLDEAWNFNFTGLETCDHSLLNYQINPTQVSWNLSFWQWSPTERKNRAKQAVLSLVLFLTGRKGLLLRICCILNH